MTMPSEQQLSSRIRMATEGWDCTCTPPPHGDGPEIDCPVHGIQACVIKELVAEIERLRTEDETLWRAKCGCGTVLYQGTDETLARTVAGRRDHPHGIVVLQRSKLMWDDVEAITTGREVPK